MLQFQICRKLMRLIRNTVSTLSRVRSQMQHQVLGTKQFSTRPFRKAGARCTKVKTVGSGFARVTLEIDSFNFLSTISIVTTDMFNNVQKYVVKFRSPCICKRYIPQNIYESVTTNCYHSCPVTWHVCPCSVGTQC